MNWDQDFFSEFRALLPVAGHCVFDSGLNELSKLRTQANPTRQRNRLADADVKRS
jgi:hypothetical protein